MGRGFAGQSRESCTVRETRRPTGCYSVLGAGSPDLLDFNPRDMGQNFNPGNDAGGGDIHPGKQDHDLGKKSMIRGCTRGELFRVPPSRPRKFMPGAESPAAPVSVPPIRRRAGHWPSADQRGDTSSRRWTNRLLYGADKHGPRRCRGCSGLEGSYGPASNFPCRPTTALPRPVLAQAVAARPPATVETHSNPYGVPCSCLSRYCTTHGPG